MTEEFEKKLLENRLEDEARTARKREKRSVVGGIYN